MIVGARTLERYFARQIYSAVGFVLFGFLALAALNSAGIVPPDVKAAVADISSFLIITAIAALGIKTSLLALARIGIAPVMLLITQTVFIGLLVVALIYGLRTFT